MLRDWQIAFTRLTTALGVHMDMGCDHKRESEALSPIIRGCRVLGSWSRGLRVREGDRRLWIMERLLLRVLEGKRVLALCM